jgi:dienelactone hydrolase
VSTLVPVLFLGLAGFCFGGAYALHAQRKPIWSTGLVAALGLFCLAVGWLYL